MRRVAVCLLWSGDRLLLQLRDFTPDIYDPGLWGLFGGHLADDEAEEAGLRRELIEEIGWCPPLERLGTFDVEEVTLIVFRGQLDVPLDRLRLGEGQDLGAFTISELEGGNLLSPRLGRRFPMTAITRRTLDRWGGVQMPSADRLHE